MPITFNLETLIEEHSLKMAEQIQHALEWAGSEADIRHECDKLIDEFINLAGLKIKGRQEYGLAGGFIDSKYGGVVIEYKDPKGAGKITANPNAPGVKALVEQIQKRFQDLHSTEFVGMDRIFGVGCDGLYFVFVHHRGRGFEVETPQPVTVYTIQRLLRALVSVGARALSFTPENLATHFGAESSSAQNSIRLIHEMIHNTDNPKAQTFFRQWQILFGEVCGYNIQGHNAKVRKLGEHYAIHNPNPAELLFAVHTYYALFIKLLAAEIVATLSPLGTSTIRNLITAPTAEKLRDDLRRLEQGGIWSQFNIRNFLEGDLFSWYLDAWNERSADAIRGITTAFEQFDPHTLSADPTGSRDLLKQLYLQLFPRSVRHDLGEYYTPDWLADVVLDELGYDGNPEKRLLDPACGSGTFLVMALNRVKAWFTENRFECGFGEDELLRKVLENIVGFDLNPLAVMAARTNYLLSIRGWLRNAGNVELPVFLCDSIMTPVRYGERVIGFIDQKTGLKGWRKIRGQALIDQSFLSEKGYVITDQTKPFKVKTAVHTFEIPAEIALSGGMGVYAEILEFCILHKYSSAEFLQRCESHGIPVAEKEFHIALYDQLCQLDTNNQNGIWARIIKNAFAPLFRGKFDLVAGNPPWINWESLPEGYRDDMKSVWQEYGLFTLSGSAGRLGGGKKDLSMLFVYSAVDNYLQEGGRLGFVITQSVFKTQGAGDGFRQLQFSRGQRTTYLKPLRVHDLSAMQVFEGATNRTAVFVCEKRSRPFSFPVDYRIWRGPGRIAPKNTLDEVKLLVNELKCKAVPVEPKKKTAPWLTASKRALSGIKKVLGKSNYRAYAGTYTGGLNGCFWIQIILKRPNGQLFIENMHDVGKFKVQHLQVVIEPDLVYPLLRGRDVHRWHAESSAQIILTQDPKTRRGIPVTTMKLKYPRTWAYLRNFEGDPNKCDKGTLWGRSSSSVRKLMETGPFYSIFAVGPYTMSKWKVVWREQSALFQAAAIDGIEQLPIIPDHKLMLVPLRSSREAHYLCAMLNSAPSLLAIASYALSISTSTHVLENIAVPEYQSDNESHQILATLSQRCHAAAAKKDRITVSEIEHEINLAAAKIWGITKPELRAIQEALSEMHPGYVEFNSDVGIDDE